MWWSCWTTGKGGLLSSVDLLGVGKTSLLAAGIVPRLDPEQVNPAMPLRDYGHASPYLRVQLWQRAKDMGLGLPEETPIPELVKAITQASSQRLVLILDQFERFFQSDVSLSPSAMRCAATCQKPCRQSRRACSR